LIYLGVKHSFDLPEENSLIVDIGGGSVEVMVVNPHKILFLKSLKIGVVRMKDLFLKKKSEKELVDWKSIWKKLLKPVATEVSKKLVFSKR